MRRIGLLVPLLAAVALAGSVPTASAAKAKQEQARPPTLLWLAFPLKQPPETAGRRTDHREAAAASATGSGGFHKPMVYLLVAFVVSAGIAVTLLTLLWTQLATSGARRRAILKRWHGNARMQAPRPARLREALPRRPSWLQLPPRPRRPALVAATASAGPAPREPAARREPARIMQALRRKPIEEHAPDHAVEVAQEPEPEGERDDMLRALVAAERAAIISVDKEQDLKLEARERALVEKDEELQARAAELEAERDELQKRALQLDRNREQTELALAAERRRLSERAQEALELERARLATAGKKLEQRERELAAKEKALAAERAKLDAKHAERRAAVAAERAELEAPRAEIEQRRAGLEKRELQLARDRKTVEQRERELAAKEKALQARAAAIEHERERELAAARKALAAGKAKLEAEHANRVAAIAAEKEKLEAAHASLEQKRAEVAAPSRPKATSKTKREPKKTATRRPRARPAGTKSEAAPARQQAAAAPRQERSRAAVPEACEIALWRGYVKWHFYTSQVGAYRLPSAVASEPFMRLRDENSPTHAAEQALAGLLGELTGNGWVVVAKGPRWYDYRLERG